MRVNLSEGQEATRAIQRRTDLRRRIRGSVWVYRATNIRGRVLGWHSRGPGRAAAVKRREEGLEKKDTDRDECGRQTFIPASGSGRVSGSKKSTCSRAHCLFSSEATAFPIFQKTRGRSRPEETAGEEEEEGQDEKLSGGKRDQGQAFSLCEDERRSSTGLATNLLCKVDVHREVFGVSLFGG